LYISAASALGLKETLPPYLKKNLTMEDLKTGVTFGSAGSGYNNATCKTSVSRASVCIGRDGSTAICPYIMGECEF
jgi:hypothetical protein